MSVDVTIGVLRKDHPDVGVPVARICVSLGDGCSSRDAEDHGHEGERRDSDPRFHHSLRWFKSGRVEREDLGGVRAGPQSPTSLLAGEGPGGSTVIASRLPVIVSHPYRPIPAPDGVLTLLA